MSTTQATLAHGGNVVGHSAALQSRVQPVTTTHVNTHLIWAIIVSLTVATLTTTTMYVVSIFHAFSGQVNTSTTTAYTYTAHYDPAVWIWLALGAVFWLASPPIIFLLLERLDEEVGTLGNAMGIAVTAVVLIGMSAALIPSIMLKQDLAAHANGWLQQHLQTTYDVTNELGAQDRFTQKLDALTITGKTVNFYLSRANSTVMIRIGN